jgi:hypothetical protein
MLTLLTEAVCDRVTVACYDIAHPLNIVLGAANGNKMRKPARVSDPVLRLNVVPQSSSRFFEAFWRLWEWTPIG